MDSETSKKKKIVVKKVSKKNKPQKKDPQIFYLSKEGQSFNTDISTLAQGKNRPKLKLSKVPEEKPV